MRNRASGIGVHMPYEKIVAAEKSGCMSDGTIHARREALLRL